MTLDETIKHYEEVAELYKERCRFYEDHNMLEYIRGARGCAKEYRQLAEWLSELKAYEEAKGEIIRKRDSGQWSEGVVYGLDKAVRIMEKHLMEVNADGDKI